MKNTILFTLLLLAACQPSEGDYTPDSPSPLSMPPNAQYTEDGLYLPDFIPALQPFVNEGCNTAWDNISGLYLEDGSFVYFKDLPDYTEDPTDFDKSRFTFIFQCQNPWHGIFEGEEPYTHLAGAGWYTIPISHYGSNVCEGLQEIRTWVLDEVTGRWYFTTQVCWVALLCAGQGECGQGHSFSDITYIPYTNTYTHLSENPISNH